MFTCCMALWGNSLFLKWLLCSRCFKMTTPPSQTDMLSAVVYNIAFGEHMHHITDHNGCSITGLVTTKRSQEEPKGIQGVFTFSLMLLWCHHLNNIIAPSMSKKISPAKHLIDTSKPSTSTKGMYVYTVCFVIIQSDNEFTF